MWGDDNNNDNNHNDNFDNGLKIKKNIKVPEVSNTREVKAKFIMIGYDIIITNNYK